MFVCCAVGVIVLCSFASPLLGAFVQLTTHATPHRQPATCNLLTWRCLLDVDASFVLAYDFTFRRFPMQLHIRPRSAALHDERFVCVAHHAMLRRTQCQAVMVIGQDASCNERNRERERGMSGWAITLVNGSLIATAAAQLATRLKCKLKTCFQA